MRRTTPQASAAARARDACRITLSAMLSGIALSPYSLLSVSPSTIFHDVEAFTILFA